jgi:uncharacterized membrane protein (UPF0182 family)
MVGVAIALVVIGLSLRSLAVLWTNQLWFSSEGFGSVFTTLLAVKVGLAVVFGVIFFLLLWGISTSLIAWPRPI